MYCQYLIRLFSQLTKKSSINLVYSKELQLYQFLLVHYQFHMNLAKESLHRSKIEFFSFPIKGHTLPILKIIQILNRNPNIDSSFVTGALTKKRMQRLYPTIKMVQVQDEYDETAFMEAEVKGTMLQIFFNYLHKYFKQKTNKPDLIIADFFMLQAFNYATRNQIKFIVHFPTSYRRLQGIYNILNIQRSVEVEGYTIMSPLGEDLVLSKYNTLFNSFRSEGIFMISSFIGLDSPAILPSNHILVGILPSSTSKRQELGKQLTDWMNKWRQKTNNKFLYISFGSMLKLSESFAKKIVRVVQKLQYPTIWSLRCPFSGQIQSEFIYHRSWLPQQMILQQEDVRAYLTHGGWGSVTEAVATSTPMVCIPVFADQLSNAQLIVKRHIAIGITEFYPGKFPQSVDFPIQQQTMMQAIRTIMQDSSYLQSIKRISRMSRTYDTAQQIRRVVERLLEFGCEYLISPSYQQATIKDNSVPLKDILNQKYWPLIYKRN